jgi:hypothetical protein
MKKFRTFIVEQAGKKRKVPTVNDKISTAQGQRHATRYFGNVSKSSPGEFTIARDHPASGLKAGDTVNVHGSSVDSKENKTVVHANVNGKSHKIPAGHLKKPDTSRTGRYVDEHAFVKMGNHSLKTGKKTVDHLHSEIDNAKSDPSHPLHFDNAHPEHFYGKEKIKNSESSYYDELKKASHTVAHIASHPEFKKHWNGNAEMSVGGSKKIATSDIYRKGGTAPTSTSKADVIKFKSKNGKAIGQFSLKDEKGAQLMSGSTAEVSGVYRSALHVLRQNRKISAGEHAEGEAHVVKLARHVDRSEHDKANHMIKKIHDKFEHAGLDHEFYKEAITGNHKFSDPAGKATHVVVNGKKAMVAAPDEYVHHLKFRNKGTLPRPIAGPNKKSNAKGSTVRIKSK